MSAVSVHCAWHIARVPPGPTRTSMQTGLLGLSDDTADRLLLASWYDGNKRAVRLTYLVAHRVYQVPGKCLLLIVNKRCCTCHFFVTCSLSSPNTDLRKDRQIYQPKAVEDGFHQPSVFWNYLV